MEGSDIYNAFDYKADAYSGSNLIQAARPLKNLLCPSNSSMTAVRTGQAAGYFNWNGECMLEQVHYNGVFKQVGPRRLGVITDGSNFGSRLVQFLTIDHALLRLHCVPSFNMLVEMPTRHARVSR